MIVNPKNGELVELEVEVVESYGTPDVRWSKKTILIRKDWVFNRDNPWGILGKWDETDEKDYIQDENGRLIFTGGSKTSETLKKLSVQLSNGEIEERFEEVVRKMFT